MIASVIPGTTTYTSLAERGCVFHEVAGLGREERIELTKRYLLQYGKQHVFDQLQAVRQ